MARLLSVNVGLPREIAWKGGTVHTAIWKQSVHGRVRARKLNLDGDGQADLGGHGGEQRAVFVYQMESYRHWQERLKRSDFVYGQFGENFTIEGLPDDSVCIGDRFRIGGAIFEVTQPRVTCYRVGIRMNEPRMPALLTSSGRPGFYFRVLQEGDVGAGDEIIRVKDGNERMTVREINALLYSSSHPRDGLERALRIQELSPGWRWSFEQLLRSSDERKGNAGLAPTGAAHPAAPGFRSLQVAAIDHESADVLSFTLRSPDGQPLPKPLPGQYVVLRLPQATGGAPLFRSYSLSGPVSTERYRISVKIEPKGEIGSYLRERVRVGDAVDVSSPRGSFVLEPGNRAVVLVSAGIGVTPVLAMLHALAGARSTRRVVWLHGARDGEHHPFAAEVERLLGDLPQSRSYVCYSRPGSADTLGTNFNATGHLSESILSDIRIPQDADVFVCGPNPFLADMKVALSHIGTPSERIHIEIFSSNEAPSGTSKVAPHRPKDDVETGPLVSFARSGIAVHWTAVAYRSILELAEVCDVPVHWSCRTGVCHRCESGLISGSVAYEPEPLDRPPDGNVLICCAQPAGDVVVDL
jgi:ferredoxin-NADP reductase/MOSC domain-containing protein YiiM